MTIIFDSGVRTVALPGGDSARVNRYLLANKGAQALVYYWYEGRGRVEPSEYRVKWNLIRDAARYGRTEEALVRIVVPVEVNLNPVDHHHILLLLAFLWRCGCGRGRCRRTNRRRVPTPRSR